MTDGSGKQRAAVLLSMLVGAVSGTFAGVLLGYRAEGVFGGCCFAGFGFSGGLTAGCVAAAVFAKVLRPADPGGPEVDYDDGAPRPGD